MKTGQLSEVIFLVPRRFEKFSQTNGSKSGRVLNFFDIKTQTSFKTTIRVFCVIIKIVQFCNPCGIQLENPKNFSFRLTGIGLGEEERKEGKEWVKIVLWLFYL